MRDGKTERLPAEGAGDSFGAFLSRFVAKLVLVTGADAGHEWVVAQERTTLGRGPGVDVTVDSSTISRQHAALDFKGRRFRIRDLGSTNGVRVNGETVESCDLANGDRVQLGGEVFQLVIDERRARPQVWVLPGQD